jgi:TonB C terminal
MLPSQHRNRYALFVVLSLLVHTLIVTVLMQVPVPNSVKQMENKTVTVKLKQETENKTKSSSKEKKPKKAEPKKAEPKKAEPKKAEPKKAEPKKAEPKKAEPKKAEPKKAEPKKAEPKKTEPKKVEPKKVEPKKVEPKKAEPKKAEPKKAEPKKAETKKAEPVKNKPSKVFPDKALAVPPVKKQAPPSKTEKVDNRTTPKRRVGSMEMLDDRSMSKLVVASRSLDQKYSKRNLVGEKLKRELSRMQLQEFNATMQHAFGEISKHIKAPPWDGYQYYGEINFYVLMDGTIDKIVIKTPSGHEGLDKSMVDALLATKRLPMPTNLAARQTMFLTKKLLYYNETDMRR